MAKHGSTARAHINTHRCTRNTKKTDFFKNIELLHHVNDHKQLDFLETIEINKSIENNTSVNLKPGNLQGCSTIAYI